ncbi:MAG TPA: hypothetical protein VK504_19415, partial [Vicinamibacterales bacterium]|nr:hypothetical protein [Vicinamibacterales bacterium]
AGAAIEAPTPFNQGSSKVAEAAKLIDANRPDQAIEAYGAAKSAFAAATTQARQVTGAKSEIVNVLKRFQSGYIQKDPHLIREVYPAADTDKIFRSLKDCSKLNLTFGEIRIDLLSNGQAQADVASVYGCQPKTGQSKQSSITVSDTFRLARRDGSWVIVSWLIPLG